MIFTALHADGNPLFKVAAPTLYTAWVYADQADRQRPQPVREAGTFAVATIRQATDAERSNRYLHFLKF